MQEAANGRWRGGQNTDASLSSLYLRELSRLFNDAGDPQPIKHDCNEQQMVKGKPVNNTVTRTLGFVGNTAKFAYFKVRLGELKEDHVLTFWHLNEEERVKLYRELVQDRQKEGIFQAAQWLKLISDGKTPEEVLLLLRRDAADPKTSGTNPNRNTQQHDK